jgi:shikimate kinase
LTTCWPAPCTTRTARCCKRRPRAKLQSLLEQRDPLYREVADIVVDTSQQNVNLLVSRLLDQLHNIPAKT